MSNSIKAIFAEEAKHVVINDRLAKRITDMMYGFANRDEETIKFLGGNLTGTYRIKFTNADKNELLIDILDLDYENIRKQVLKLPDVNADWIVSTDVFNMTCQWVTYMLYNSNLNAKKRHDTMIHILMILHFKLLGSILHQFFPYRVDERLAMATYAAMSLKFALKRLGTWYASLEERCEDIISPKSIHLDTIKKFEGTEEIRYMIQDIQNRLRIRVRKIHATMRMVADQDKRMMTVSGTVNLDGEVVVREVARNTSAYTKYLDRIVLNEREFFKDDLITVIVSEMQSVPEVPLADTVRNFVKLSISGDKRATSLRNDITTHLFKELSKDPDLARAMNDPALFINKLKYIYMASRSSDPLVLKLRDTATKITMKSVKIKTVATVASIRTGLMLYIVLRMLTKNKYE